MNHVIAADAAVERVTAYLDQLDRHQRGLDREIIASLNNRRLLSSDLRALIDAVQNPPLNPWGQDW